MRIFFRKSYYFLMIVLLFFSSCEYMFFKPSPEAEAVPTFEYLWNKVNEQYAFFDVKDVNWNNVYDDYSPFIHNGMAEDSLFHYLAKMLNTLKDGHVNLISGFNVSRYDISLLGPQNIDFRLIKEHYLGEDYYVTGPFQHDFIAGGEVGYIRYASFFNNFSDDQILFMLERYRDTKALILDMRQNGGGFIVNIYKLFSHFCHSDTALFTTSIKSGSEPDAFSPALPVFSTPYDSVRYYDKPIAVLIDRGSYSATSMFALATLPLNNIILVGDTTGGGLGMPNGGQLPNGWTYRFSITRTLTIDGINYENGVPPDIYAILDPSDKLLGLDTVIETALDTLLDR
jgi:hypothetical protein